MNEKNLMKDFQEKFSELNLRNQRYIFAIQQALMYAQENEKETKDNRKEAG